MNENNACIRFPISKRMRTGVDEYEFGAAGNALSDLSFLGFGAAGAAMFCKTDMGTLSEGVGLPIAAITLTSGDTNSYKNPESSSSAAIAMSLPSEAAKRFLLDFVANQSNPLDRKLSPTQFFNAQTNAEMSIATRAMFLGDETRAQKPSASESIFAF